jgi:hypothetical protein
MDRAYSTSIYYDFLVTGIKIPDYNMKRSSGTIIKSKRIRGIRSRISKSFTEFCKFKFK